MADFLQAVDTDSGKQEPIPVTLVSGGQELSVLPTQSITLDWADWADPANTVLDATKFDSVEVHLIGLSASTPYTVQRNSSATGTFSTVPALASDYSSVLSITTPGFYTLPGRGFLKLPGAGFTVRRRASA